MFLDWYVEASKGNSDSVIVSLKNYLAKAKKNLANLTVRN